MKKRQKKLTGGFHRCHVRKGDQVQVIAGDHKGKTGTIISVSTKIITGPRVKVQGVNFVRKKVKDNQDYKYIEAEEYIHASNVRKI